MANLFLQLEAQLEQERGRSESLNDALQQCEDRIVQLEREQQLMADDITRLEEDLRRRDEEISQYSQKAHAQVLETESLQKEIDRLKNQHLHLVDEQPRALEEATGSKDEARKQLQDLARQKAEVEAKLKSSDDRHQSLKNEMDRLRKHTHELQQESADKEVKIVQFTKQHTQDKEDIQGLNIALDAKQQELELVCRELLLPPAAL